MPALGDDWTRLFVIGSLGNSKDFGGWRLLCPDTLPDNPRERVSSAR